jgi:hypothetical protein
VIVWYLTPRIYISYSGKPFASTHVRTHSWHRSYRDSSPLIFYGGRPRRVTNRCRAKRDFAHSVNSTAAIHIPTNRPADRVRHIARSPSFAELNSALGGAGQLPKAPQAPNKVPSRWIAARNSLLRAGRPCGLTVKLAQLLGRRPARSLEDRIRCCEVFVPHPALPQAISAATLQHPSRRCIAPS